jgi:hypothetical protein
MDIAQRQACIEGDISLQVSMKSLIALKRGLYDSRDHALTRSTDIASRTKWSAKL